MNFDFNQHFTKTDIDRYFKIYQENERVLLFWF